MSVIVIGKLPGDTAVFQSSLAAKATEFKRYAELAQAQGAIHHRFGIGDGYVVIVDEWESMASFEKFMSNPDLQAFIAESGASGVPEITIADAISTVDEF